MIRSNSKVEHTTKKWHKFYNKRKKLHKEVLKSGREILVSENFEKIKEYIQHGDVSINCHCICVALCSLAICDTLHIKCRRDELVRGALLHDYFLYDWHKDITIKDLHGFFHPSIALKNAKVEFNLTRRECDIIKKHMWPLTFFPPMCTEAWIVTLADKWCSIKETIRISRGHVVYNKCNVKEEV